MSMKRSFSAVFLSKINSMRRSEGFNNAQKNACVEQVITAEAGSDKAEVMVNPSPIR